MFADPKGAPPEATPDKVRPESLPPPPPPHETTKNAIKIKIMTLMYLSFLILFLISYLNTLHFWFSDGRPLLGIGCLLNSKSKSLPKTR
jgi:hypothetical protein